MKTMIERRFLAKNKADIGRSVEDMWIVRSQANGDYRVPPRREQKPVADRMTGEKFIPSSLQLGLWVFGVSVHNGRVSEEGECCPDFSCCRDDGAPDRAPPRERLVFVWATVFRRHRLRNRMLSLFMSRMVAAWAVKNKHRVRLYQ